MPKTTFDKEKALQGRGTGQPAEIVETASRTADVSRLPARIVSIPLSQILPDRFQSRVILPPGTKEAFFNGEVDCYQAARLLLNAAEGEQALGYQVAGLLSLGDSILQEGQIEPGTGRWVNTSAGPRFLLEIGERRFWGLVLQSLQHTPAEEFRLKVEERKETSRVRQVSENVKREDLSAVDFSKAVASLILALQDIEPAPGQNELEYFRQALEVRVPRGLWPRIKELVNLDRSYLYRHLQILGLDDQLLYLASIYRLEEYRLREIMAAPPEKRRALMYMAIEEKLTQADIARLVEQGMDEGQARPTPPTAPGPHRQLASRIKSLVKFVGQPSFDRNFDEVAREFAALLRNPQEGLEKAAADLEALADSMRRIRARFK